MIAVTGANGLLGSFIIKQLLHEKQRCIAIVRENSDLSLLKDSVDHIEIRKANTLDPVAMEEALTGVTSVIHAAATVSFNPRRRNEILHNNISSTRNVVNACLHHNIKRLLHVSSVAALGRQKGQTHIDESNKWTESSLNSTYAESKYYSELEIFRGQEEGLSTVIINPSVILAPADWNKSSAQLFKYVWKEKPFYINSYLNYVDVRDVAAITSKLLFSEIKGHRFILNGGNIPFKDFFTKIASHFNKKAPSIRLNKNFLKAAAVTESMRSFITGNEPLITSETALLADTQFNYSAEKIRKALNYRFQDLDGTLQWCCEHYLNFNAKK